MEDDIEQRFGRKRPTAFAASRGEACAIRAAGRRDSRGHDLVARLWHQHSRPAEIPSVENLRSRLDSGLARCWFEFYSVTPHVLRCVQSGNGTGHEGAQLRCVMTTLPQADLPQDHGILRTAAQCNQPFVPALGQAMPSVGVYANVLRAGTVRRGDPVRVQQAVAAA
jgi:hypothetical protein